eukprot:SAG11_NODE_610_length_8221_cov_4.801650_5_plen_178_part_00
MSSRVQATPMRALQERSALSRSQRRASTSDIDMSVTTNSPIVAAAKQKRTTRKAATSQDTYDRWGLDLSHFETSARLKDHIKGAKAGELRHIEKWCSLSHDGLLGERRERFLEFIDASFEHAQLAYCCYFWEDMMTEINTGTAYPTVAVLILIPVSGYLSHACAVHGRRAADRSLIC